MRQSGWVRAGLVLITSVSVAACGETSDETETNATTPAAFAQCKACHSVELGTNGIGPSLAGVFGGEAGHVGDFAYSSAMRESGLVWNEPTLDAYLANPQAVVPGTKMSYAGLRDDAARAELIEWLKGV